MTAAKTILCFGIYMLFQGVVLILAPNVLLTLVNIPQTNEVWIRFVGLAFLVLGYYYIRAAEKNLTSFFYWTVHARIFQFLAILAFVYLDFVSSVILIFSGIELAFGLWTRYALQKQSSSKENPKA